MSHIFHYFPQGPKFLELKNKLHKHLLKQHHHPPKNYLLVEPTPALCPRKPKKTHGSWNPPMCRFVLFGCFLKWWYPHFTPQVMIIFRRKNPWVCWVPPTILGFTPLIWSPNWRPDTSYENTIENTPVARSISFYKGENKVSQPPRMMRFQQLRFPSK